MQSYKSIYKCLIILFIFLLSGCERFSKYKGYSRTFSWDGDYQDKTACDSSRRRKCTIVAIDALHFRNSAHQYMPNLIERELNKVCQYIFVVFYNVFYKLRNVAYT